MNFGEIKLTVGGQENIFCQHQDLNQVVAIGPAKL